MLTKLHYSLGQHSLLCVCTSSRHSNINEVLYCTEIMPDKTAGSKVRDHLNDLLLNSAANRNLLLLFPIIKGKQRSYGTVPIELSLKIIHPSFLSFFVSFFAIHACIEIYYIVNGKVLVRKFRYNRLPESNICYVRVKI